MNVIIGENLFDADYVSRFTVGFEELKERAEPGIRRRELRSGLGFQPTIFASWRVSMQLLRPSVIRVNYRDSALGWRRDVDARGHHARLV